MDGVAALPLGCSDISNKRKKERAAALPLMTALCIIPTICYPTTTKTTTTTTTTMTTTTTTATTRGV